MRTQSKLISLLAIALMVVFAAIGCSSSSNNTVFFAPSPETSVTPVYPNVTIKSITLSSVTSATPVVTFTIQDELGSFLSPTDASLYSNPSSTTGGPRIRFIIAQLGADGNYQNYIKNGSNKPSYDSGNDTKYKSLGDGVYQYTFTNNIKDTTKTLNSLAFDAAKTHTLGMTVQRTVTTPSGKSFRQTVNPYVSFVPNGDRVTQTREIVATSNCNECHTALALHGGSRIEVAICILCHNKGVTDSKNVESVNFKFMVHRLHMGEKLYSAASATYALNGSVFGNEIAYPAMSGDSMINNTPVECTKCHRAGTDVAGKAFGKNVDNWKTKTTRENCTTCHNTTTFDGSAIVTVVTSTAKTFESTIDVAASAHTGGNSYTDDSQCASCHQPGDGETDYSNANPTVTKVHLVPFKSDSNPNYTLKIVSVANNTSGSSVLPTVTFKVLDRSGNAVTTSWTHDDRIYVLMGFMTGPDYDNVYSSASATWNWGSGGTAKSTNKYGDTLPAANADGSYTFTLPNAVPPGLTGVGTFAVHGKKTIILNTQHRIAQAKTKVGIAMASDTYYFDLATGAQVTSASQQRRKVVDTNKCNLCHMQLNIHGGHRTDVQICVMCHGPHWAGGFSADGALTFNSLKDFLHGLHMGENLSSASTTTPLPHLMGAGGIDLTETLFPGDVKKCTICHISDPTLPVPAGAESTIISWSTSTPYTALTPTFQILPTKAACTSCHDDPAIAGEGGHADSNTVSGVEQCATCHASGASNDIGVAHDPAR